VEAIFILISLWLFITPTRIGFSASIILWSFFGIVTVIDLEHRLILHPVSIAGVIICTAIGIWLHDPLNTFLGGIAGFVIMLLLYFFGQLVTKLLGRIRGHTIEEDALGFGDVNLGAVIGLLLGWPGIIAGVIFTIIFGGIVSLIYLIIKILLKQYQSDMVLPYGPFLVASAIFLIYFRGMI
jgi:leader peptidase (prepilin peptidase)/N-methyltransferase